MFLTAYDGAILGPIAKILGWIMNGIYNIISNVFGFENVALSIILLTFVIYMCLFPITYKQQKFSMLSQKMQPELQKIQKKYKDKKDQNSMMAMQEETQAIYQKYGISPMGSCGFMLINFPILLALYQVFRYVPAYITGVKDQFSSLVDGIMSTVGYQDTMAKIVEELKLNTIRVDFASTDKGALSNYIVDVLYSMNSNGWDMLSEKFSGLTDVIASTQVHLSQINNLFGMNISDSPLSIITTNFPNHNYLIAFLALMIPVASYLTQVLNIKLMPQAPTTGDSASDSMANSMKMMNIFMPLVSLFFCFGVPVGLGLYWIISALIRSVQQFLLNRHFQKVDLDVMIKKNQEKAKKKREKLGISENQINNMARMNTRKVSTSSMSNAEKEQALEKAAALRSQAKPGSMAAKANRVKEFNEKNSR
ncbi:MAG: YidC/Oxa1 family membrane protein insertase [Roseburia sp.]|nr:YidC/Oxa1 family membrane protein insertase [Roseburia sp.]